MSPKNTICLWFDGTALDAARFYAETFPGGSVTALHRAPGDHPSGTQGDVLTVEFTVVGIRCLGPCGGSVFKHREAFSFHRSGPPRLSSVARYGAAATASATASH